MRIVVSDDDLARVERLANKAYEADSGDDFADGVLTTLMWMQGRAPEPEFDVDDDA